MLICPAARLTRNDGTMKGDSLRAPALDGAHCVGNGRKAANSRCDDGGGSFQHLGICRLPAGLQDSLLRCGHGKQDEAIHPPLVLDRNVTIGIEASLRVLVDTGNDTADLGGEITGNRFR